MNNDELKKKIVDVINAADISVVLRRDDIIILADALIAAGIGDVKESENKVTAAELVAQAAASTAIEKIEERKHRAEVAERALDVASETYIDLCGNCCREEEEHCVDGGNCRECFRQYCIEQAEKELAEERKDENN